MFACEKEFFVPEKEDLLTTTIPQTAEEKLLVKNLGKVAEIFKELYQDENNLRRVNAAILSEAFRDESVLIRDLIDSFTPPIYARLAFL
ncbi:MAG: hypothetical protein HC913_20770 [Microscillaceae bacterium]|nr:hypothetical protein [Microscillaceae bacterium]